MTINPWKPINSMAENRIDRAQLKKAQRNDEVKKIVQSKDAVDQVVLSKKAKIMVHILKALANTPEVREDKMQKIARQFADGTYDVSAEKVAGAMVNGRNLDEIL